MVGPLGEDARGWEERRGESLEEQVDGGGRLDKQAVGSGARGTGRWGEGLR